MALPVHVLALLREDEENAGKFEACRSRENLAQIPPKWFTATEIKTTNHALPGMLVKVADSCLWDKEQSQDVGEFWLFRQAPTGYQLMFTAHTQALQVLNTRTGGCPDLCTRWGQYAEYYQTIYNFQEGRYLPFLNSDVILDPPPPPPSPPN